ncbi:MAG: septum formation protein Maf [Prevotella sp.]|nr:septum formation protein Maf [Prevotella sp.]
MKKIILSSNSPRRKELLAGLDIPFEVKVLSGIDESYPEGLSVEEIPQYIAMEKAAAYDIAEDEIVITADTVVVLGDAILGKPVDENDAKNMLRALSGNTHRVVTGVCITSADKQRKFSVVSEVTFKVLSDTEIDYYVNRYRPFDKAGAYGIQEWIGYVGVTSLKGSYFNVMGLPVQRIYEELIHEFDVVVK